MKDGRVVIGRYPENRVSVKTKYEPSIDKKAQVFTEPYDGEVFCAEVPTYHTLVTRREGKILISGNCVGNGWAKQKSYRAALDVYLDGQAEKFPGMFCAEWEYYASRKECDMLRSGDGSSGYGAAQASTMDGALPYGGIPGVDAYSESRCRAWGRGSVPAEAVQAALPHTDKSYVKVDTAEKVWLAAGAALPMAFCSDRGFEGSRQRDADGTLKPGGTWGHCMCGASARYTTPAGRKLVLVDQSWGDDWVPGPYYLDQPMGSFYADLDVVGKMAAQGDTFVAIDFQGFPIDHPEASPFLAM